MKNYAPLLLVFIKLFKLVKIFKGLKGALFGASTLTYGLVLGWQVGFLLMVILTVHEIGHVVGMRSQRLKIKGLYFIPLLGAAMVPENDFTSRRQEFIVAIAGPIAGMLPTLLLGYLYLVSFDMLWEIGFTIGLLLTFLNLLPLMPLDGGRVMRSIAFSVNRYLGWAVFIAGGLIVYVILFGNLVKYPPMGWIVLGLLGMGFAGSGVSEAGYSKDKFKANTMGVPGMKGTASVIAVLTYIALVLAVVVGSIWVYPLAHPENVVRAFVF